MPANLFVVATFLWRPLLTQLLLTLVSDKWAVLPQSFRWHILKPLGRWLNTDISFTYWSSPWLTARTFRLFILTKLLRGSWAWLIPSSFALSKVIPCKHTEVWAAQIMKQDANISLMCQLEAFLHHLFSQTDLMMVVVHQASDYVGLFFIQLLQDIGRVWRQVHQIFLSDNFTVVFCFNCNVLHATAACTHTHNYTGALDLVSKVWILKLLCYSGLLLQIWLYLPVYPSFVLFIHALFQLSTQAC